MSFYETSWFVDLVLITIYVLTALTLSITAWSVLHGYRRREEKELRRRRPLRLSVAALLVVTLIVSWLLGSTEPIIVNGRVFADAFWLRISDMFIWSSLVLIVIAVGCTLYGMTGLQRKVKSEK